MIRQCQVAIEAGVPQVATLESQSDDVCRTVVVDTPRLRVDVQTMHVHTLITVGGDHFMMI